MFGMVGIDGSSVGNPGGRLVGNPGGRFVGNPDGRFVGRLGNDGMFGIDGRFSGSFGSGGMLTTGMLHPTTTPAIAATAPAAAQIFTRSRFRSRPAGFGSAGPGSSEFITHHHSP
jgi:hypothetical protein